MTTKTKEFIAILVTVWIIVLLAIGWNSINKRHKLELSVVETEAYQEGYEKGYEDGKQEGYEDGYYDGLSKKE